MDHADVLNKILSNTCPSNEDADGNKIFTFDLCGAEARVVAISNQDWDDKRSYVTYNIISVDIKR